MVNSLADVIAYISHHLVFKEVFVTTYGDGGMMLGLEEVNRPVSLRKRDGRLVAFVLDKIGAAIEIGRAHV